MHIEDRIAGILGFKDPVTDWALLPLDEKIAASIELRDNPVVQVAGQFSQQQPSAMLPQLSESLTQLAIKQVQEQLNQASAITDPMEAENGRLRKQIENLKLQKELQELQASQQAGGQQGAPTDMMGGGDVASAYGAVPPYAPQGMGDARGGQQVDPMEAIRNAAMG